MTLQPIEQVVVYTGHASHPKLGPYPENKEKRVEMFETLNAFRSTAWKVSAVAGEKLVATLEELDPLKTLVVIPAGRSSDLDAVFKREETQYLHTFFQMGGRGYFTCGAAYWVSHTREYSDLDEDLTDSQKLARRISKLPLFEGVARGPLCIKPSTQLGVSFYTVSIEVTTPSKKERCRFYLSGGGGFEWKAEQNALVTPLALYPPDELKLHGVLPGDCKGWECAALKVIVGRGSALLSMFHPEYGADDIQAESYTTHLSHPLTNWHQIKRDLGSEESRMKFTAQMIASLENEKPNSP